MSASSNETNRLKKRHIKTSFITNVATKLSKFSKFSKLDKLSMLNKESRFDKFGNEIAKENEFTVLDRLLALPVGTGEFSQLFRSRK